MVARMRGMVGNKQEERSNRQEDVETDLKDANLLRTFEVGLIGEGDLLPLHR